MTRIGPSFAVIRSEKQADWDMLRKLEELILSNALTGLKVWLDIVVALNFEIPVH
jgi:hypothetical protein